MITDYIVGLDKLELTLKPQTNQPFNPVKYFRNDDDDRLNLFEIGVTDFSEVYEYKDFILENKHKASTNYNMTYDLHFQGQYIGRLLLDNRNNNYSSYVAFKVDNRFLYDPNCKNVIKRFLSDFGLQINNYSSLDIYIDSRQNIDALFVQRFNDKKNVRFNTRVKHIDYFGRISVDESIEATNFKPSFYMGSKKTGKGLVIYNKTLEIAEKSKKDYISELHDDLLVNNYGDPVYRFELRLMNTYLKSKKYVLDLDLLFDEDYLKTIVKGSLPNFFDFRENSDVRISRCTPLSFIDFDIKTNYKVKGGLIDSNNDSRQTISSLNRDRTKINVIKKMIKLAVMEYDLKALQLAKLTAISYNLMDVYKAETKNVSFVKPVVKPTVFDVTDIDLDSLF